MAGLRVSELDIKEADDAWEFVKEKVIAALCGPQMAPVPSLQDAKLYQPFCAIVQRYYRAAGSLRRTRRLFPVGPLQELLQEQHQSLVKMEIQHTVPISTNFHWEEVVNGIGHVQVTIPNMEWRSGLVLLSPRTIPLRTDLQWWRSAQCLYVVSEVYCSSSLRLGVRSDWEQAELQFKEDTPVAFSCLRFPLSSSGFLGAPVIPENGLPHAKAQWVKTFCSEYAFLHSNLPVQSSSLKARLSQIVSDCRPSFSWHSKGTVKDERDMEELRSASKPLLSVLGDSDEDVG
uniref:Chromosome LG17 open reading frame, human C11orf42 n=1 Tax=Lepisosteus oculatus TaxID=7918 RepID=W5MHK5_LEPOC|nr:PREDICTED: uncharacterized protein C11orf42 homolog isoform X1 [Lepisosteus oculatus]